MTLEGYDHRNRDWSEERATELKALRSCGWSCLEISRKMGFSRNSIIGKLYRMGFAVPQEAQDTWTDAETQTLKDCWAAGHSVTEVGEELLRKYNVQRSNRAISAKADRLHLAKRIERRKLLRRPIPPPIEEPKAVPDVAISRNIPFMDLESIHCREVTGRGDDGLATYCGHRRAEGYSYCVHHRNINILKINHAMRRLGG
jgi:hypothetical protein